MAIKPRIFWVSSACPTDTGGGSSYDKLAVMDAISDFLDLKSYLELGVWHGRSFFSMASSFAARKGHSYGVDPYRTDAALQKETPEPIAATVDNFIQSTDYDTVFENVVKRQQQFGLTQASTILRHTSQEAAEILDALDLVFDMIHIDANHDSQKVLLDLHLHLPRLSTTGILILDDIDWPSLRPAFDFAASCMELVFKTKTYAIFTTHAVSPQLIKRLKCLCVEQEALALDLLSEKLQPLPVVSVSMITYNHERFVAKAIESVLGQQTTFPFELVISDDGSSDQTPSVITEYANQYPDLIRFIQNGERLGAVKNYLRTFFDCRGKYIAMLEGDDFWTDPSKLARQVALLEEREDYVISCHNVWQADPDGTLGGVLLANIPAETSTADLAQGDYIATASCVIRASSIHHAPDWLLAQVGCDWTFNLLVSEGGKIGFMPRVMAAYRRHEGSLWQSMASKEQALHTLTIIDQTDYALSYRYRNSFERLRQTIWAQMAKETPVDGSLIILDDAFPHPQSGFRLEEFTAYLETFSDVQIYATGEACDFFKPYRCHERIVNQYTLINSEARGRIVRYRVGQPLRAKLAYTVFASNAWRHLRTFERDEVPFVFTLYPGGGFFVNNAVSDQRLREIFSSPMFRRVIVTQTFTRDYLIERKLCDPESIILVYGVVTPRKLLTPAPTGKSWFGFGKATLDVCFAAHKYTPDGRDKGYDFFLDVARRVSAVCPEAYFHVCGGFSEADLPVDELEGRIRFYGSQNQSWFQNFYKDKDLILLANQPFILHPGGFDGFPTACGSDAMLCETVLLCTDPLDMNMHFQDGEDLILIPRDVDEVAQRILQLREQPELLRHIGETGARAARNVYSVDQQIGRRIEILVEELALSET